MTQSPSPKTKTMNQPRSAAILLLLTILDTTWRTFFPTVGGTILGVSLDNQLHTAPLYTALFISVGIVLSVWLIGLQLRKVRKS